MTAVMLFENEGPTDGIWLAKNEHDGFENLEPEHLQPSAEIRNEAPAWIHALPCHKTSR